MTTSSEKSGSRGGEGRGLPVGWGWRPPTEHEHAALRKEGSARYDVKAAARENGSWSCYLRGGLHETAKGTATPRPGETLLAAGQREAEAALWACDGYGTGEVRGRFVAHGQGFGLPGRWRLKAARAVPGGHEVDAMREGVEVDAVRAPSAGDRCPACGAVLPSTGIGCGSCRWMGEPLPGDAVRAPAAGDLCPACGAALPGDAVRAPSGQAVVAEWCCSLCKWHGATPERIALGRRCPSCHGEASLWIDYSFADEDAVRAPAEPIRIAVDAPGPLGLGVGEHDAPGGEAPCSCGAWHHATAAALSPAPVPFLPLGVEGITPEHEARLDAVIAACTGGEPRPVRSLWSVAAEMQGEPAPREPSAPTALPAHYDDGERREWIAEALGVPSRLVFLGWSGPLGWALNTITIKRDDVPGVLPEGIRADEIATLAAAGIVATAKGWTFAKEQGR